MTNGSDIQRFRWKNIRLQIAGFAFPSFHRQSTFARSHLHTASIEDSAGKQAPMRSRRLAERGSKPTECAVSVALFTGHVQVPRSSCFRRDRLSEFQLYPDCVHQFRYPARAPRRPTGAPMPTGVDMGHSEGRSGRVGLIYSRWGGIALIR